MASERLDNWKGKGQIDYPYTLPIPSHPHSGTSRGKFHEDESSVGVVTSLPHLILQVQG